MGSRRAHVATAVDGVKFNSWMAVNCSAAITSHYPCIYNSNSTVILISYNNNDNNNK